MEISFKQFLKVTVQIFAHVEYLYYTTVLFVEFWILIGQEAWANSL